MTDETESLDIEDSQNEWEYPSAPSRGRRVLSGLGSAAVIVAELVIASIAGYMLGYILGVVLDRAGNGGA